MNSECWLPKLSCKSKIGFSSLNSAYYWARYCAEQGDVAEAFEAIASAEPYSASLVDARGVAGFDYLLIARTAKDPKVVARAIDSAVSKLDNNHPEESCKYNLACAGKEIGVRVRRAKEKDIARATELLVGVIDTIKTSPVEPQVDAILKDPLLKPIALQPQVCNAVRDFKWEPLPFGAPASPSIRFVALWSSDQNSTIYTTQRRLARLTPSALETDLLHSVFNDESALRTETAGSGDTIPNSGGERYRNVVPGMCGLRDLSEDRLTFDGSVTVRPERSP